MEQLSKHDKKRAAYFAHVFARDLPAHIAVTVSNEWEISLNPVASEDIKALEKFWIRFFVFIRGSHRYRLLASCALRAEGNLVRFSLPYAVQPEKENIRQGDFLFRVRRSEGEDATRFRTRELSPGERVSLLSDYLLEIRVRADQIESVTL